MYTAFSALVGWTLGLKSENTACRNTASAVSENMFHAFGEDQLTWIMSEKVLCMHMCCFVLNPEFPSMLFGVIVHILHLHILCVPAFSVLFFLISRLAPSPCSLSDECFCLNTISGLILQDKPWLCNHLVKLLTIIFHRFITAMGLFFFVGKCTSVGCTVNDKMLEACLVVSENYIKNVNF